MITRRLVFAAVILFCVSCKEPARPAARTAGGPTVRGTVVTIRTTTNPARTTRHHAVVIAGDRARDLGEHDTWRLYDVKAGTVTTVDDVAKTVRTEPLQTLLQRRRAVLDEALPAHYPRVTLVRDGTKRTILNVSAQQHVIETGKYRRELWLGEHPSIPRGLFAMMYVTEPPSTPLAPMMKAADAVLTTATGYPLLDKTTVPFGKDKLVVERAVVAVVQKDVPESLFTPPKDYLDLTPRQKK